MGFGSYDESEQEKQEIDTGEEDSVDINREDDADNNEIEFDFGDKSTEELLEQMEE